MKFGKIKWACFLILILWIGSIVYSTTLFNKLSYSPILLDRNGELLAAIVAKDGQWRFPNYNKIPETYKTCLIHYEDKRFYSHLGVDPIAIIRAAISNFRNGKIVSGGSTITMQLVRLSRKSPARNFIEKGIEIWAAIGVEFTHSKSEILSLYASLAPYGGNVVGLETALWRYYNKSLTDLSWSEAAMLAVLPNQPSMIHLSKNRDALKRKRNLFLTKLMKRQIITQQELELGILEEIPDKPILVPRIATHALHYLIHKYPEQYLFRSTLDQQIQARVNRIGSNFSRFLRGNEISNLASIVIDNSSQEILAYMGNVSDTIPIKNGDVDMIQARRSSGSILKPLLFAAMINEGMISEKSIYPDVPTLIHGFRPENFSRKYQGAVSCEEVIQQSLNVPSVRMLRDFGVVPFYKFLKSLGIQTLFRDAEDYGLSLILGGAEVTMWEVAKVYSGLANTLSNYYSLNHRYDKEGWSEPNLLLEAKQKNLHTQTFPVHCSAASIYKMFDAMQSGEISGVENSFILQAQQQKKISWKTGTSFGFKDAWCVGVTPEYTVVSWVGNASGLGRPGLIGIHTAAPIMFDIYRQLNYSADWYIPYDDMNKAVICKLSGYLPNQNCNELDTIWMLPNAKNLKACTFHERIFLDSTLKFRVFADCEIYPISKNYFVLPPVMEHYYKSTHPHFIQLPPLRIDCDQFAIGKTAVLDFIYPNNGSTVILPVDLDEHRNDIVLRATHKSANATLYWFMDEIYLGTTTGTHEYPVHVNPGKHMFMISDDEGNAEIIKVNVIN